MKPISQDDLRNNVFRLIRVITKKGKNKEIADYLDWDPVVVSQKIMPDVKKKKPLKVDDLLEIAARLKIYTALFFWQLDEFDTDESLLDWVERTSWYINQNREDRRLILKMGIVNFQAMQEQIHSRQASIPK